MAKNILETFKWMLNQVLVNTSMLMETHTKGSGKVICITGKGNRFMLMEQALRVSGLMMKSKVKEFSQTKKGKE